MDLTIEKRTRARRTRKYLEQILGACKRVEKIEAELDELRSGQIAGIAFDDVRVQSSGNGGLDQKVIRIMEYEAIVDCEKTTLLTAINKIKKELTFVHDLEKRDLLSDRYIRRKKWDEIEKSFYGDRSTMYRRHDEALLDFYDANKDAVEEFMSYHESCD